MKMNFQWVTGDKAVFLNPTIQALGWTPITEASVARIAFDEKGELAGFYILQPRPHAEPMWVRPDLRGSSLAHDLAGDMEDFLESTNVQGFMCIAETPEAIRLCEKFGMKRVTHPVYMR